MAKSELVIGCEYVIKLVCVLSTGGVPVYVKSVGGTESEMLLGALIEASKSLSALIGSGQVRNIAFKDDTLLMTESEKGYTIVMLVNKAESYMERLLQILAEALDYSSIPKADGTVISDYQDDVEEIMNTYILQDIETPFPDVIDKVWKPILRAIQEDEHLSGVYNEVQELLNRSERTDEWNEFASKVETSLPVALEYAYRGAFDYACAASFKLEETAAKLFAIKMGTLSLSMANTHAPPQQLLQQLVSEIPGDHALYDLAEKLVRNLSKDAIPADYTRAFRGAVQKTELGDSEKAILTGVLFLDNRVVRFPEFTEELKKLYSGKTEVVDAFVNGILERGRIFENLYSITSFDAFRGNLAVYKARMKDVLKQIDEITAHYGETDPLHNPYTSAGIAASFHLQNYIALLTALCESPILALGDREEILKEIIALYEKRFLKLIEVGVPLFAFTIDSVFQSLSVALAEYYHIVTGQKRKKHVKRIVEFLRQIFTMMDREWPKPHLQFSLTVIGNALLPILTKAEILRDEEIKLMIIAMKSLDVDTIDAMQYTKPIQYAINLGNVITSLTALADRLLTGEEREEVLPYCIQVTLEVHTGFLARGVVCRDDIRSATNHALLGADTLPDEKLKRVMDQVIALNMIAIRNIDQYDYEVPMLASPFIEILKVAAVRLGDYRYRKLAAQIYRACMEAWHKYGFETKAENFRRKFGDVAEW
ncbi:MAG: hypothetical protein ACTSYL_11275 [Candidatus Thorarchaeota archaeon]